MKSLEATDTFISILFLSEPLLLLTVSCSISFLCQLLSRVQLFVIPWTVAHQAPLSMEFSRQDCWSGLPFPPPEDLPNSGTEPGSAALQADSLLSEPPGKPAFNISLTESDEHRSAQCVFQSKVTQMARWQNLSSFLRPTTWCLEAAQLFFVGWRSTGRLNEWANV